MSQIDLSYAKILIMSDPSLLHIGVTYLRNINGRIDILEYGYEWWILAMSLSTIVECDCEDMMVCRPLANSWIWAT